jgi:cytochrome bd-type quinol oxidase subunit 2
MRNYNLIKIANVLTIVTMLSLALMPFTAGAQFNVPNSTGTNLPNQASFSQILLTVIQILLAVAGLVAVVFLIIGGFRYITAGGNEESSESAKKTITNAIIGIVIIILSFVIVRVIANALISNTV